MTIDEEDLRPGDTIRVAGIVWDMDEGDDDDAPMDSAVLTIPQGWDPEDGVADILSDISGYCVSSIGCIERV